MPWFGATAILIVIFGTLYGVVQQSQRTDANYPQLQIAQDTAAALNQGDKPSTLVGARVNVGESLAPFTIIYAKSGQVVAGSGLLNGTVPRAPYGILTAANGRTFNYVTWQPQGGVRIAAVTVAANYYYVLSGRSLREVEANESHTLHISLLGGVASLIVLAAMYLLTRRPVRS